MRWCSRIRLGGSLRAENGAYWLVNALWRSPPRTPTEPSTVPGNGGARYLPRNSRPSLGPKLQTTTKWGATWMHWRGTRLLLSWEARTSSSRNAWGRHWSDMDLSPRFAAIIRTLPPPSAIREAYLIYNEFYRRVLNGPPKLQTRLLIKRWCAAVGSWM